MANESRGLIMIEMVTENYQNFIIYSSYVCVFLYLLFFIYKQWSQIHVTHYPFKNFETTVIIDPNFYRQRMNCCDLFLHWLPKTIRRKENKSADEPDGLFFLQD